MKIIQFAFAFLLSSTVLQAQDSAAIAQRQILHRADSLIARYKFEEALYALFRADSTNIDVLDRIGQCYFKLGASSATIGRYERILLIDSINVNALNQLGQLYARGGDFTQSLLAFQRLHQLDAGNSYYCKQLGMVSTRMNDFTSAKHWYRKTLHLNPTDVETFLALGNILMETEEYESVDSVAQQGLMLEPQFKPLLQLRAKAAFEQQHFETVVALIDGLLEKSDTTAVYARMLGISYFHLKEYGKLTTCMNYLLKNRFDFEWIYYYMGVAARELGDVETSVNWFRVAGQKSISDNTKIYYSEMGKSYEQLGDYANAIKAYRTAYNYSKDGILLYHLARNYDVYYKDKTTALAYYRKYLESDDTIRLTKEYARRRMQDMGEF